MRHLYKSASFHPSTVKHMPIVIVFQNTENPKLVGEFKGLILATARFGLKLLWVFFILQHVFFCNFKNRSLKNYF